MLQIARLAPTLLGESSDLVRRFFHERLNPEGGFQNRAGESDLYYTVFGIEGLLAMGEPVPSRTRAYLDTFANGDSLDLVHLSCLARCWAAVEPHGTPPPVVDGIFARLQSFRSADGGYALATDAARGSAYACFLALSAAGDLEKELPDPAAMLGCIDDLRAAAGGYANHPAASEGSTPATAAAVMVMRHLDRPPDASIGSWLLARCHRDGGFFAAPGAPIPDLLSTATALHALAALDADTDPIREPSLDFLDSLWTSAGGFYGSWSDPTLDCEYTYYGLLALGHLSL